MRINLVAPTLGFVFSASFCVLGRAATSVVPEFHPPSEVETACSRELEKITAIVQLPKTESHGYTGGGTYALGPIGPGERSVHVSLADKEIIVDAVTGSCTSPKPPPGLTAHQLMVRRLELAVETYKLRLQIATESGNEVDLNQAKTAKKYINDTLNKCSGFTSPRGSAPDWLEPKLKELRQQLVQLAKPTTPPAAQPEPAPEIVR